ncbi:hypothetical protein BESB_075310 [Besnoitia besnoiti]|uniref:Uncharacterized protein n=1 Tax=Besnoitia besnoiti TaxID=94643 RepID=A0A2A9M909_BESBE|nr:uncharacterized protein BESB_075310 [Besnoitia besnoiti]PFH34379.1 hypothetical protein BESB_075310 [Besnoitia besnoiti]
MEMGQGEEKSPGVHAWSTADSATVVTESLALSSVIPRPQSPASPTRSPAARSRGDEEGHGEAFDPRDTSESIPSEAGTRRGIRASETRALKEHLRGGAERLGSPGWSVDGLETEVPVLESPGYADRGESLIALSQLLHRRGKESAKRISVAGRRLPRTEMPWSRDRNREKKLCNKDESRAGSSESQRPAETEHHAMTVSELRGLALSVEELEAAVQAVATGTSSRASGLVFHFSPAESESDQQPQQGKVYLKGNQKTGEVNGDAAELVAEDRTTRRSWTQQATRLAPEADSPMDPDAWMPFESPRLAAAPPGPEASGAASGERSAVARPSFSVCAVSLPRLSRQPSVQAEAQPTVSPGVPPSSVPSRSQSPPKERADSRRDSPRRCAWPRSWSPQPAVLSISSSPSPSAEGGAGECASTSQRARPGSGYVWSKGFSLPLGKLGRQKLLRLVRRKYRLDRAFWGPRLREHGFEVTRFPRLGVEQLWAVAHLVGVFDNACQIAQEHASRCAGEATKSSSSSQPLPISSSFSSSSLSSTQSGSTCPPSLDARAGGGRTRRRGDEPAASPLREGVRERLAAAPEESPDNRESRPALRPQRECLHAAAGAHAFLDREAEPEDTTLTARISPEVRLIDRFEACSEERLSNGSPQLGSIQARAKEGKHCRESLGRASDLTCGTAWRCAREEAMRDSVSLDGRWGPADELVRIHSERGRAADLLDKEKELEQTYRSACTLWRKVQECVTLVPETETEDAPAACNDRALSHLSASSSCHSPIPSAPANAGNIFEAVRPRASGAREGDRNCILHRERQRPSGKQVEILWDDGLPSSHSAESPFVWPSFPAALRPSSGTEEAPPSFVYHWGSPEFQIAVAPKRPAGASSPPPGLSYLSTSLLRQFVRAKGPRHPFPSSHQRGDVEGDLDTASPCPWRPLALDRDAATPQVHRGTQRCVRDWARHRSPDEAVEEFCRLLAETQNEKQRVSSRMPAHLSLLRPPVSDNEISASNLRVPHPPCASAPQNWSECELAAQWTSDTAACSPRQTQSRFAPSLSFFPTTPASSFCPRDAPEWTRPVERARLRTNQPHTPEDCGAGEAHEVRRSLKRLALPEIRLHRRRRADIPGNHAPVLSSHSPFDAHKGFDSDSQAGHSGFAVGASKRRRLDPETVAFTGRSHQRRLEILESQTRSLQREVASLKMHLAMAR